MILKELSLIKGLKYFDNFITVSEKQSILRVLQSNAWCGQLRRKQQYYGIKYFQTKIEDAVLQPKVSTDHYPLQPFNYLIERTIQPYGFFHRNDPPNQVLVNRYISSDKLGVHVEDTMAFGDVIVGVSLGDTDYLKLADVDNRKREYLIELKDRSCYVLSEDARFKWKHGIGRAINNVKYKEPSFQRISLTIRHVIDTRRKLESQL